MTLEKMFLIYCEIDNINNVEILTKSRKFDVIIKRHQFTYIIKNSYNDIYNMADVSRFFNQTESNQLNSVKRIANKVAKNPIYRAYLDKLIYNYKLRIRAEWSKEY